MVDVNTQNKTISVNVSSSGVSSNVNASGDTAMYYSNKSKEYATSDKLIDGKYRSSKYYSEQAQQSALNAQSFAQYAQDSYKQFQDSVDGVLSTVNNAAQTAITDIDIKGDEVIDDINNTKTIAINDIEFVVGREKQEIEQLSEETQSKIIDLGIDTRANVDLSNLSSIGEKHFLNKNQITNCLLEVPQRIKYDLAGGVLTIKAGTVVIVPYGVTDLRSTYPIGGNFLNSNFKVVDSSYVGGKFFVWAELQNDYVCSTSSTTSYITSVLLRVDTAAWDFTSSTSAYSGDTEPSNVGVGTFWYDTANNLIKKKGSSGFVQHNCSLPLMLVDRSGSVMNSVTQVFNGIGYFAGTIWVDKGVKGLASNGFNQDGTYKNEEWVRTELLVFNYGAQRTKAQLFLLRNNGHIAATSWEYQEDKNLWVYPTSGIIRQLTEVAEFNTDSNYNITSFAPKRAFRAVDYSDIDGEWVGKNQTLFENTPLNANSALVFDISDYLPKDGYSYEVVIVAAGETGSTSGNMINASFTGSVYSIDLFRAQTRTTASVSGSGTGILVVGADRKISLSRNNAYNGNVRAWLRGYRKVR